MANFQFSAAKINLAYLSLASFEADKMFDLSGQKFLSDREGTRYKAYQDSKGIWTIGRGITYYEDGKSVQRGDTITPAREMQLFNNTIQFYVKKVNEYVTARINQNQFNALVSFTYNVGTNALKTSTLLKRVNKNPIDPDIKIQFMKWVNSGGRRIPGLVTRRASEVKLYFS